MLILKQCTQLLDNVGVFGLELFDCSSSGNPVARAEGLTSQ